MHELVRCIFSHLPNIDNREGSLANGSASASKQKFSGVHKDGGSKQLDNGNNNSEFDGQPPSLGFASTACANSVESITTENTTGTIIDKEHLQMTCYS
ncbi:hypothetical protein FRX31_026910 [Thalictrum thalictroides]|uniref:Uncharacterized protein n=1 Tax=Thalictrum thalictroides TaxID=46969 RepID=A0A7J6VEK1_THATH|nr:hypothetical protein FRX31_026910 [Thalictrum thalictroides]